MEEAIQTAIDFEKNVCLAYQEAEAKASEGTGKKIFGLLAREEEEHVAFLVHRLEALRETGSFSAEGLETAIPTKAQIEKGLAEIEGAVKSEAAGAEIQLLERALEAERKATEFYRKMVEDLPEEGQALFRRFLEIEEGHLAVVQAEIDYVSRSGVWFDFMEFTV